MVIKTGKRQHTWLKLVDQIAEAVHFEAPAELQVRAADIATNWVNFQAPLGFNRDDLEQGRLTDCCRTIGYHRE
jgi:hypothetical protein